MSPLIVTLLLLTMVATSFLSGIFGMAGGMILIGVLLALMPLPQAMVLHAVTQMASNGWRGALWWRYVMWRPVAYFLAGCLLALIVWTVALVGGTILGVWREPIAPRDDTQAFIKAASRASTRTRPTTSSSPLRPRRSTRSSST